MHTVTHPDFFWSDRYMQGQGTHKGTTMVGAEEKNFKICITRCCKNALHDPVCS